MCIRDRDDDGIPLGPWVTEMPVEHEFDVAGYGRVKLVGSIDLFRRVHGSQPAVLIDYKVGGSWKGPETHEPNQEYFRQLNVYRLLAGVGTNVRLFLVHWRWGIESTRSQKTGRHYSRARLYVWEEEVPVEPVPIMRRLRRFLQARDWVLGAEAEGSSPPLDLLETSWMCKICSCEACPCRGLSEREAEQWREDHVPELWRDPRRWIPQDDE